GGKKLEVYMARFATRIKTASTVRVGFLENARYPGGMPVAAVAAFQEFGTPSARFPIPPRPFFRNMIAKRQNEWPKIIEIYVKRKKDGREILAHLGDVIAGQLRQSIIETNDPALSPVTKVLRVRFGNNPTAIRMRDVLRAAGEVKSGKGKQASGTQAKPLVWTGHMLNSVQYQVK